jgi:mannan endo-1,4-beta-mannosidase
LLNSQSAVHASWIRQLDTMASGLEELRDAGVVVLWRPFHEMNGGWFWWCNDDYKGQGWTPREDFAALWKHMFDYFTHTKKLNNLLWVYSPNAQLTPAIRPTDFYYPGSDYVDIVGYDLYYWKPLDAEVFDMNGSYSKLAALNKPFGLCEFGPGPGMRNGKFDNRSLIDGIREHCPNACFFFYRASWSSDLIFYRLDQRVAIIDNGNGPALMTDPWVVTRDEVGE